MFFFLSKNFIDNSNFAILNFSYMSNQKNSSSKTTHFFKFKYRVVLGEFVQYLSTHILDSPVTRRL